MDKWDGLKDLVTSIAAQNSILRNFKTSSQTTNGELEFGQERDSDALYVPVTGNYYTRRMEVCVALTLTRWSLQR